MTPLFVASIGTPGDGFAVHQSGTRSYVGDGYSGVQIYSFLAQGEGLCLADCSGLQTCGDGTANGSEACDDGDTDNCTLACNATCTGP